MSSQPISGTQSPPLEAGSGNEKVLGKSSVGGGDVEAVPDSEQRKEYFKSNGEKESKEPTANPRALGQSLADSVDQRS